MIMNEWKSVLKYWGMKKKKYMQPRYLTDISQVVNNFPEAKYNPWNDQLAEFTCFF